MVDRLGHVFVGVVHDLPSRSSVSRRAPWGRPPGPALPRGVMLVRYPPLLTERSSITPWGRPPGPALPRGVMLDLSVSNGGYLTTLKSQPCLTAAFALAAAALIPLPVWAQGGFNGPGRYEISNVRSGKVIDLDRNNQTSVIQFSARNTDNQQWDIVPAEPRFWYFRNAMNGAALEQVGPGNSTPVRGMPFTGSPSQQWRIAPASDGNALITNRLGKTLDIPNASTRDGARVQTYDVNGEANQRFVFRRLADLARHDGDRDADDWDRDRRWERYYGRFDEREHRWGMEGDGVCFYREPGYRGRAFCGAAGEEVRRLPDPLIERFAPVKCCGRVRGVDVFGEEEFGGQRARIEHDQPDRVDEMRRIVSIRVFRVYCY